VASAKWSIQASCPLQCQSAVEQTTTIRMTSPGSKLWKIDHRLLTNKASRVTYSRIQSGALSVSLYFSGAVAFGRRLFFFFDFFVGTRMRSGVKGCVIYDPLLLCKFDYRSAVILCSELCNTFLGDYDKKCYIARKSLNSSSPPILFLHYLCQLLE
jgi:hypothetical protein